MAGFTIRGGPAVTEAGTAGWTARGGAVLQETASSGITISCEIGTAAASGQAVSVDETLSCALFTATAGGHQAVVASGDTVSCALGTSAASGYTASLAEATACNLGTATADGHQAAIYTGGPVTLNCNLGTAVASGVAAAITGGNATISFRLKNNTATPLANGSGIRALAYQFDGTLMHTVSGITLDGNADGSFATTNLVAGTAYAVFFMENNGSAVGARRIVAT